MLGFSIILGVFPLANSHKGFLFGVAVHAFVVGCGPRKFSFNAKLGSVAMDMKIYYNVTRVMLWCAKDVTQIKY